MENIKKFEQFNEKVITFIGKRNPKLVIRVTKNADGKITNIENKTGIRFCFSVGQTYNRNAEIWAANNNFLVDGIDHSPEEKLFGIKVSDIPKGHELRSLYPNKFKK